MSPLALLSVFTLLAAAHGQEFACDYSITGYLDDSRIVADFTNNGQPLGVDFATLDDCLQVCEDFNADPDSTNDDDAGTLATCDVVSYNANTLACYAWNIGSATAVDGVAVDSTQTNWVTVFFCTDDTCFCDPDLIPASEIACGPGSATAGELVVNDENDFFFINNGLLVVDSLEECEAVCTAFNDDEDSINDEDLGTLSTCDALTYDTVTGRCNSYNIFASALEEAGGGVFVDTSVTDVQTVFFCTDGTCFCDDGTAPAPAPSPESD